jgi:hypothetical protein
MNTRSRILAGLLTFVCAAEVSAAVDSRQDKETVILSNEKVIVTIDLANKFYSLTDAQTQEVMLDQASMVADGPPDFPTKRAPFKWGGWKVAAKVEDITDAFGKGKKVVLSMRDNPNPVFPNYLFSYALHEGSGAVIMGFGIENPCDFDSRLMNITPMAGAMLMPGKTPERLVTLNGSAGSEKASVKPGPNRDSANSLMLTCIVEGKRRTVVWGGLENKEFGKWVSLSATNALGFTAKDPVGRLVDKGQTYWANDTFYVDVTTRDPFLALEHYGRAMRVANDARPNVYDFPVLCGWGVGALSKLPDVNNSVKLVGELEAARKAGLTQYTKVGIRLEPDKYHDDTEQGWWDDAHWAKFGHLVAPCDTFAKWCAAIRERDGIPYTYFQVGMPSHDYSRAFPDHMLFKDISRLHLCHPWNRPPVTFDYTSQGFQRHMREVWRRLKQDGICGIKFDYPETGWRPEGGFENRHATTAFAYREAFRLAREGLGPEALLDERNLGESERPCLDLTAGLVDTQRNWTDSNRFVPAMVTIGGLRWYKNRTVFNYYPDSKTVHDCTPEVRQSMLTMVFLTSGRIDLATSFTLFTPEITHDFSRIYPAYREPYTARPLDAFTGVTDPQVYDLELTPDWHQVALFNTASKENSIEVPLSGDRVETNAIGLDSSAAYYVYDFWADQFVGKFEGTGKIQKTLKPLCCAMLSVRRAQPNPQVISTSRHVLQGWVELADVKWTEKDKTLSGTAKVIGGEPFCITIANNGSKPVLAKAKNGEVKLEQAPEHDLSRLVLERQDNGDCHWLVSYE